MTQSTSHLVYEINAEHFHAIHEKGEHAPQGPREYYKKLIELLNLEVNVLDDSAKLLCSTLANEAPEATIQKTVWLLRSAYTHVRELFDASVFYMYEVPTFKVDRESDYTVVEMTLVLSDNFLLKSKVKIDSSDNVRLIYSQLHNQTVFRYQHILPGLIRRYEKNQYIAQSDSKFASRIIDDLSKQSRTLTSDEQTFLGEYYRHSILNAHNALDLAMFCSSSDSLGNPFHSEVYRKPALIKLKQLLDKPDSPLKASECLPDIISVLKKYDVQLYEQFKARDLNGQYRLLAQLELADEYQSMKRFAFKATEEVEINTYAHSRETLYPQSSKFAKLFVKFLEIESLTDDEINLVRDIFNWFVANDKNIKNEHVKSFCLPALVRNLVDIHPKALKSFKSEFFKFFKTFSFIGSADLAKDFLRDIRHVADLIEYKLIEESEFKALDKFLADKVDASRSDEQEDVDLIQSRYLEYAPQIRDVNKKLPRFCETMIGKDFLKKITTLYTPKVVECLIEEAGYSLFSCPAAILNAYSLYESHYKSIEGSNCIQLSFDDEVIIINAPAHEKNMHRKRDDVLKALTNSADDTLIYAVDCRMINSLESPGSDVLLNSARQYFKTELGIELVQIGEETHQRVKQNNKTIECKRQHFQNGFYLTAKSETDDSGTKLVFSEIKHENTLWHDDVMRPLVAKLNHNGAVFDAGEIQLFKKIIESWYDASPEDLTSLQKAFINAYCRRLLTDYVKNLYELDLHCNKKSAVENVLSTPALAKQTLSKARALCKQEGLTKSAKNSVQSIIYRSLRLRQPELYQAIVNPSWWTRLKAFFGIGLYAKMKLFVDSDVNLLLDKYENIKVLIASKSDLLDAESFFPYINKLLTRSLLGENALHFVTSILEALMSQCDKQEDYKALQRLTGGLINRMLRNAQRQPALMRFFVSKELMLLPWHIEKDPQILVDMLNWPKLSKPMIAKLRGFLGELNDEAYCQTFLKAVIKNPPKQLEHFQDQVFALYEKFDIDMIDSVQTSKTAFMLKHAKQLSQKIPQLCRKIFNKLLPKITDKQLKVHYGDLKNMVHDKSINKTDWQACLDRLHFDTHKQAGTLLKWRESNGCGVDRSKQRQSMVGHRVV